MPPLPPPSHLRPHPPAVLHGPGVLFRVLTERPKALTAASLHQHSPPQCRVLRRSFACPPSAPVPPLPTLTSSSLSSSRAAMAPACSFACPPSSPASPLPQLLHSRPHPLAVPLWSRRAQDRRAAERSECLHCRLSHISSSSSSSAAMALACSFACPPSSPSVTTAACLTISPHPPAVPWTRRDPSRAHQVPECLHCHLPHIFVPIPSRPLRAPRALRVLTKLSQCLRLHVSQIGPHPPAVPLWPRRARVLTKLPQCLHCRMSHKLVLILQPYRYGPGVLLRVLTKLPSVSTAACLTNWSSSSSRTVALACSFACHPLPSVSTAACLHPGLILQQCAMAPACSFACSPSSLSVSTAAHLTPQTSSSSRAATAPACSFACSPSAPAPSLPPAYTQALILQPCHYGPSVILRGLAKRSEASTATSSHLLLILQPCRYGPGALLRVLQAPSAHSSAYPTRKCSCLSRAAMAQACSFACSPSAPVLTAARLHACLHPPVVPVRTDLQHVFEYVSPTWHTRTTFATSRALARYVSLSVLMIWQAICPIDFLVDVDPRPPQESPRHRLVAFPSSVLFCPPAHVCPSCFREDPRHPGLSSVLFFLFFVFLASSPF